MTDPATHLGPSDSDPVTAHVRVCYVIPLRRSEVLAWSTPPDDDEDDGWIFEVEAAVKDKLPDLLERAGEPDVEVE